MGDLEIPCKYFIKGQKCPYETKCRFRHEAGVETFNEGGTPRTENSVEKKADSRQQKKERPKPKNCYFYLHSHCRYGSNCRFNHPKKLSSKINKNSKSTVEASSHIFPVGADCNSDEDSNHSTNASNKHSVAVLELAVENISEPESAPENVSETGQTEVSTKPRPAVEDDIKQSVIKDPRQRSFNTKDLPNDRSRKTNDYRSQNPPPLTLEAFLTRPPVKRPQKGSHKAKESGQNVREIELEQLQMRFPGEMCNLLEKSKEKVVYLVQFKPTDKDWHGPELLPLTVTFPESYPQQFCHVELSASKSGILSPATVEMFNLVAQSYWKSDMLGTLMFRPFLHWLDKNILELLHVQPEVGDNDGRDSRWAGSGSGSGVSGEEEGEESEVEEVEATSGLVKSKKGTEVRLLGLEISQSLGTAYWTVLNVVLACSRCKAHRQIELKEDKVYSVSCERCNSVFTVVYHLALVHANTFTLGYLELANCSPVDVVFHSSSLTMTCLNCSCEVTSKGCFIDQPKDEICRRCHGKMTLSASGIRFLQHQVGQPDSTTERGTKGGNTVVLSAGGKKGTVDLFKDGNPLPDFGICEHYKKSHRWLRFPCCGRAFPCDVCHDSVQDHPMDRANKMICGYCSKEQTFTVKGECVRCRADMLSLKTTSHWQGGQGCRNKTKMSRSDKHKYKDSQVKTSCKKSERVGKKSS